MSEAGRKGGREGGRVGGREWKEGGKEGAHNHYLYRSEHIPLAGNTIYTCMLYTYRRVWLLSACAYKARW